MITADIITLMVVRRREILCFILPSCPGELFPYENYNGH